MSFVANVGPPSQPIKDSFVFPGLQIWEIDLSNLPRQVPSNLGLVSLELASLDP